MKMLTGASSSIRPKESRYEREQRLKIGSINGYDPKKESHIRRLLLEDEEEIHGAEMRGRGSEGLDRVDTRHAYPPGHGGTGSAGGTLDRSKNTCNITRYSGQHHYYPLSSSLSELNLAKCKTPTPVSIYHQRDSTERTTGGPGLSTSLPGSGVGNMERYLSQKARLEEISSRYQRDEFDSTERSQEDIEARRELEILKDSENRKHSYNLLPCKRSPIELDRYEDVEGGGPPPPGQHFEKFLTRALYNFKAENPRELELTKGDTLSVTRRVDANWYEGECSGSSGIFPISYVAPRGSIRKGANEKGSPSATSGDPQANGGRIVTAKYDYKAQSTMELSLRKGEEIHLKRSVDSNWSEGSIGSRVGIFPSAYVAPGHGKTSIAARLRDMPEPSLPLALPDRDNPFCKPEKDISLYRAVFSYKPQNEDEVELLEGDTILVLEKCDDGWFVGTSRRTGAFGTFPGNYVVLL